MKYSAIGMLAFIFSSVVSASAETNWSTQDYDLYPGDFNGDGITDLLYISHDPSQLNGIALSDGKSFNVPLQSWNNVFLGIPWSSGQYRVVVADFDGDGKDDLFLQRKDAGDHFLLLTEDGGVGAISQTIPDDMLGLSWSADQHQVLAGDFNGDGRADLFLQAADEKGLSAVLLSDENGQFTAKEFDQSWEDGYAGFNWAATEANVLAGDFNGDRKADLLLQAKPTPGTGTDSKHPAEFPPNLNGVVLAKSAPKLFVTEGVQAWSRDGFKAEWSPLQTTAIVTDFNGDGRTDVMLQGLTKGDQSYLLYGNSPGAIFSVSVGLDLESVPVASDFRVIAGQFDGQKSSALFLQSQSATRNNSIQRMDGSTLKSVNADASLAIQNPGTPLPAGPSSAPPGGSAAALLAVTSAGRTPGQFAVSALGGATYQIPLWTPPGARGVEPKLSLVYTSGGPDGPLGPGWALSGLSSIARCNKTYADNGAPAPITLTAADNFCIDGNRLRVTTGTYGLAGSQYQTQIANFSRVTANGTAGNGPSYFIVEGKDGLIYEYGNTADSKAYANAGSTPYGWMLNKVRDRQNNNLTITYSTTSGAIQPSSIQYTQTPATGTTYPYKIDFTYQTRVTNLDMYVAGGNIQETQILGKIDVKSGTTSVRQYILTYATAPTTVRDRLVSIQECGGSAGTDCLRPTTVSYQNGSAGIASPSTATGSGVTSGVFQSADIDGDGREDLIFAVASGSNYQWWVQRATGSGYSAPINTGAVAPTASPMLIDDFNGDGSNELLVPNAGIWYSYKWNGSTFTATSTTLPVATATSYASADIDGDGRPDLAYLVHSGSSSGTVYVQYNTSSASTISFASTAVSVYTSTSYLQAWIVGNNQFPRSSIHVDADGDGRQDLIFIGNFFGVPLSSKSDMFVLLSRPSGLVAGVGFRSFPAFASISSVSPVRWNDDGCTDLQIASTTIISPCSGSIAFSFQLPTAPSLFVDWDGDGRSDALSNVSGTWQVYRSLSNSATSGTSTGISVGTGTWGVTDQNGDGLSDLAFANSGSSNAISFGLHSGSSAPADLATSFSDGWLVSASPTYVPITTSNYSKYSNAVFPYSDFIGPMYVVSQSVQSTGLGTPAPTTFTSSYLYYGAQVNRQGRGFAGFYATRSYDSRNNLVHFTYYQRSYPYTGMVFQDDILQPGGATVISRTVNTLDVKLLAGAGCSAIDSRCLPYVKQSTATSNDPTPTAPLIQTSVTDFVYDNFGSPTSATTTATDNDAASPFSGQSWSTSVSNTYTNDVTNWCLGKPTSTTTTNSTPGPVSDSRRVDHTVNVTACRYDTETIEPTSTTLKVVKTYGYDSCGNLNSSSVVGLDKSGVAMPARVTSSNYGARCTFAENVTNALGESTGAVYDYTLGVKQSSTDANGISVSWTYDNFGRKLQETRPDGTKSTWSYNDCITATCWGASDLRFQVTEYHRDTSFVAFQRRERYFDGFERLRFDNANRVLGIWTNTQIVYNSLGLKQDVYQPYSAGNNGWHRYAYDMVDRPISDTLYNTGGTIDRSTTVGYAGLKTTLTDAKGNVTQKWTDVMGKLRRIIDPTPGGTTNYTYDPFGNLTQSVDATGATATSLFNKRGFKTSSSDPDTGSWTFTPNSLNELVEQTDAKGQLIKMSYDKLGRMISRLEPESTSATAWTYGTSAVAHEIGKLKTVNKPDGYAESYTFDSIGRPASVTYTLDAAYSINYAYNSIGTVDLVTFPTSTSSYRLALKYQYSYGFLNQVQDNASGGTVFWSVSATNDYSSPTTELLGNGAAITSGYTAWNNDLTSRQVGTGGSTTNLQNLAYQWDLNENLEQRQDVSQSLTEHFVYDSLNRLDTSTLNGVQNLDVNYDSAGNITYKSDVGSYAYTGVQAGCSYYTHAQVHAVRKVGTNVYCYDQNGNMTSRAGSAMSWYSYNQPQQIVQGSSRSSTFNYNADHQRWKQIAIDTTGGSGDTGTVTTYYIGGIMEKVVRPSGVTEFRHLIPAGSGSAIYTRRSDSTNSTFYITTDHLGSGDLITDSAATVLARESFTPFGARRGSNWSGLPTAANNSTFAQVSRRGFTGHEMLDTVNLIHMNGRVYDPSIGRFLSADPVLQSIQVSQALNPFSYVMNGPLSLADPSGYSWISKLFHSIGNFFAKWWRPILAVVVAVVSFGYLAPIASQWFAASVCLMPGTITAAGAALAGGISSALSTAVMGGNARSVLRSFVIGAATAYVGFEINKGIKDWSSGKGRLYDVTRDVEKPDVIHATLVERPGFDKVFTNGMLNDLDEAALKALQQTGSGGVTLFYNPSDGFIADLTESVLMKATGTSSLGDQLAGILHDSPGIVMIAAHSQGALITSNALGVLATDGVHLASAPQVVLFGSAANRTIARDLANAVGARLSGNDHFFDLVGNVLGFNTANPFKIVGSIVASPMLFMGPRVSPHSVYP